MNKISLVIILELVDICSDVMGHGRAITYFQFHLSRHVFLMKLLICSSGAAGLHQHTGTAQNISAARVRSHRIGLAGTAAPLFTMLGTP